ncbi:putative tripeptidyl-peptidase II [Helianthus anomalus]
MLKWLERRIKRIGLKESETSFGINAKSSDWIRISLPKMWERMTVVSLSISLISQSRVRISTRNESLGNYVAGMLVSWAFCRYDDKGHVIDVVVWHDREVWRVALDTQSLEEDPMGGKLAESWKMSGGWLLTHKVLRMTPRVGNLLNHGK